MRSRPFASAVGCVGDAGYWVVALPYGGEQLDMVIIVSDTGELESKFGLAAVLAAN